MINCYKDLKIIQIVIFAVLSLILLEFATSLPVYAFICALIAYVTLNYIIAFLFTLIAQKRLKRITDIMTEECDPYKFIEQILPLAQRKNRQNIKALLLTNLAAGYINAGDTVQAKTVLSDIAKIGTNNPIVQANICSLWAVLSINENHTVGIPSMLADLLKYSNQIKQKNLKCTVRSSYNNITALYNLLFGIPSMLANLLKYSNQIRQKNLKYSFLCSYNILTARYNLLSGKTDGVEQAFKLQLENSTHLLEKNSAHYNLATLYIKQNRIEEAKQALQFVVEHGNKLYIATKAKEMLAEL